MVQQHLRVVFILFGIFGFSAITPLLSPRPVVAASVMDEDERFRDPEVETKLKRNGAGLRIGTWRVKNLEKVAGADYGQTPVFEGSFQKGLDLHLTLESALGMWRRSQELVEPDGFGGSTRERVHSYIIPAFTGIKFLPLTRPEDAVEPYLNGAVGFAFGIDDEERETTLFTGGTTTSSNTAFLGGFGFKIGSGLDWHFSRALGLTGGVRYQWLRFGQEVGGENTYKGFAYDAGLAYRFQYE